MRALSFAAMLLLASTATSTMAQAPGNTGPYNAAFLKGGIGIERPLQGSDAALAAGAPWLCYYRAVQIGQVPRMVPIDRLSVALTLIRSVLLLYEQFTWKSGGLFCSQWERW